MHPGVAPGRDCISDRARCCNLLCTSSLASSSPIALIPPPFSPLPFIMAQANVFIVIYRLHGPLLSLPPHRCPFRLSLARAIFLRPAASYVKDRGCIPCDYVGNELLIDRAVPISKTNIITGAWRPAFAANCNTSREVDDAGSCSTGKSSIRAIDCGIVRANR